METQNEKLATVLNDLVKINNDRAIGYEKAAEETVDIDIKTLFSKLANDSKNYNNELSYEILKVGGKITTDTTVVGKFYRIWMDVKSALAGKDRKAILDTCEFGEDAAQEAYEDALASDVEMTADVRQLVVNQKHDLKTAHDAIKKLRNLAKVLA